MKLATCVQLHANISMQSLLKHVITHQPEDPISYFHEEIIKIKKEMEENNASSKYYYI